jgi:hypothetical protein
VKGAPGPAAAPKTADATAKAPAAGGAKAGEPPAAPDPAAAAARRKQTILIGAGALVVLLLGVFVYMKFLRPVDAPRLNSDPFVIGKFTATSGFDRLPFEKKWQYYELMDEKKAALRTAYTEGKMSDDEYRTALQSAWYGKHLARMRNYFEKTPGRDREAYLDKQVLKKYEDNDDDGDKKGDAKAGGKADKTAPLTAEEIERDDSNEESDVAAWPAEVRSKWEEYWKEYRKRKDVYKQAREAEKARKNAPVTKPVAVPG